MKMLGRLDDLADGLSRGLASRSSRRSFLSDLGRLLVGMTVVPVLLPVGSSQANASESYPGETGDPKDCSYWRYCAINGTLCSCNGGSPTECPPGTVMSNMAWIGTCRNPVDGKNYLISYRDCCGKTAANRCYCSGSEGVMPVYRAGKSSNIHWCQAGESAEIACSLALVLGPAEDAS